MNLAILLLNMGGPDSLEAVRPFLYNLFSDREIIQIGPPFLQPIIAWAIARRRAPYSQKNYRLIGGKTPLTEITTNQAKALSKALSARYHLDIPCEIGMRYWHPRTPDTIKQLKAQGITKVLALSLYPHYSRATSGSSINDFRKACKDFRIEGISIEHFFNHPGYIKALAETVQETIEFAQKAHPQKRVTILYSAHSLPKSMIDAGDPYLDHLKSTIAGVERITGVKGILTFQSRSGPVKWLEPATDVTIERLGAEKQTDVLVIVPISFVSDHIETLYEIDMLFKDMIEAKGMALLRAPTLNTRPAFIDALSQICQDRLKEAGWLK